jgi:tetratricopeptide (TPR) repeat protein
VKLGLGESAELGMTRNVAAYDEFLRGYAAYNEHTADAVQRAMEHMHRAIALDPTFARAWAYLYCIYTDGGEIIPARNDEWYGKAVEALANAQRLTPDSPFVHVLHAREGMRYGRRLEARARLDALPPGYWTADRYVTRDVFLGRFLLGTGHAADAVETLERARAGDPLSPVVNAYLAIAHAAAGDSQAALAAGDRGFEFGLQPVIAGNALLVALGTGHLQEIRGRAAAASPNSITDAVLPHLEDPTAGRAELHRLAAEPAPPDYIRSVLLAHWGAYFGDTELALAELRAIAHGALDEGLLWRPVLGSVRELQGFKDIVRDEGLVDYWRVNGWPKNCEPTTADDFVCS